MSRSLATLCLTIFTLTLPMAAICKDFWWPYLASYEAGPGSIRVNLGLRKQVPLVGFSHVVVTGITFDTKRRDGLPDAKDFKRLEVISKKVLAAIEATSPAVYAGTFTHSREQLHYVYVKDPSKIEGALANLYLKACPSCKSYTHVKLDPSWSVYRDFLYPNQKILEVNGAELKKLGFVVE